MIDLINKKELLKLRIEKWEANLSWLSQRGRISDNIKLKFQKQISEWKKEIKSIDKELSLDIYKNLTSEKKGEQNESFKSGYKR